MSRHAAMAAVFVLYLACLLPVIGFAAPAGQEPIAAAGSGGYPRQWPGVTRATAAIRIEVPRLTIYSVLVLTGEF
jgi:hypothetical protein